MKEEENQEQTQEMRMDVNQEEAQERRKGENQEEKGINVNQKEVQEMKIDVHQEKAQERRKEENQEEAQERRNEDSPLETEEDHLETEEDHLETAGVLMSVELTLHGTYEPHTPPTQRGLSHTFVSMGTSRPIPESVPSYLPNDNINHAGSPPPPPPPPPPQSSVIRLAYELEATTRVCATDIYSLVSQKALLVLALNTPSKPPLVLSYLIRPTGDTDGPVSDVPDTGSYQQVMGFALRNTDKIHQS
ncbi:protein enabled homolog [Engraulis encrasicolus]|uniref:protein enabled homolog n=1 Tax=Engraulis encrasicolus TaxID=184585 RepID=UPI002FD07BD2